MKLSNAFKHFFLVLRHKNKVFLHCRKCGIAWRGVVHDLSKFTPEEFFESVRYYQGNRSPIGVCRRETGMSVAWLHHKGRNKHHIEYWLDPDCAVTPMMPYKYAVECVCDKLAATKIYNGKNYDDKKGLEHWERYGNKVNGNPKTMEFIGKAFLDIAEHGEAFVMNKEYMKKSYTEICGPLKAKKKINKNGDKK